MIKKYGHLIIIGILIVMLIGLKVQSDKRLKYKNQFEKKSEGIQKSYNEDMAKLNEKIKEIQTAKKIISITLTDKEQDFSTLTTELKKEFGYTSNLKVIIEKLRIENDDLLIQFETLRDCQLSFNLCQASHKNLQMRFDIYKQNDIVENKYYEDIIKSTHELASKFELQSFKYFARMKKARKQRNFFFITTTVASVILFLTK